MQALGASWFKQNATPAVATEVVGGQGGNPHMAGSHNKLPTGISTSACKARWLRSFLRSPKPIAFSGVFLISVSAWCVSWIAKATSAKLQGLCQPTANSSIIVGHIGTANADATLPFGQAPPWLWDLRLPAFPQLFFVFGLGAGQPFPRAFAAGQAAVSLPYWPRWDGPGCHHHPGLGLLPHLRHLLASPRHISNTPWRLASTSALASCSPSTAACSWASRNATCSFAFFKSFSACALACPTFLSWDVAFWNRSVASALVGLVVWFFGLFCLECLFKWALCAQELLAVPCHGGSEGSIGSSSSLGSGPSLPLETGLDLGALESALDCPPLLAFWGFAYS